MRPVFKSPWAWWEQRDWSVLWGLVGHRDAGGGHSTGGHVQAIPKELGNEKSDILTSTPKESDRDVPGHYGDGKCPTHV